MIDLDLHPPAGPRALPRRQFLALAALLPAVVRAEELMVDRDYWNRPRQVWIRRRETGEEAREVYFRDGQVDWPGFARLCWVLRDVRAGVVAQIDLVLLDAICGAQGYLRAHGYDIPWSATSGLRTARTNAQTEGAVRDSKHMQGRATDGRFQGLPLGMQAAIARMYLTGGLGFYEAKNFLHLDTGRLREWRG